MGKEGKFSQLCKVYAKAQSDFETYKNDSIHFGTLIYDTLITYFEIPYSQISLYRVSPEESYEMVLPSLQHAMTLRDDSYWEFGLGLTLCISKDSPAEDLIIIHFKLKKGVGGVCSVTNDYVNEEHFLDKDNIESFHLYFDKLFDSIVNKYQSVFNEFVGQSNIRKIGFNK